jgi:hypothetical protein
MGCGIAAWMPCATGASAVRVNEILANTRSAEDPAGRQPGWIELYNPANASIDLAGFVLTDGPELGKYVFPANTVINAGGYLTLNFDPAAAPSAQNTGFALKRSGGAIFLYEKGALEVGTPPSDAIAFGVQASGYSIGRWPDGTGAWGLTSPTPSAPNLRADTGPVSGLRINEWSAHDGSSGDYVELYNSGPLPVSLTGLHLTDSFTLPGRFTIGDLSFIGTGHIGGFAVFAADGQPSLGPNHLNFALKQSGERLGLYDSRLVAIDTLTFGSQTAGGSEGLLPDGSPQRVFFTTSPSPEAYNRLPGPLTDIVLNELLAHTDPPLEDAVEFYNATDQPLNLQGFSLILLPAPDVAFESPQTYPIEFSLPIDARGYAVLYEYQFGGRGLRFNSAHGGTLILARTDANGFAVESGEQSFGPSVNAVSFGRYPRIDGTVEFVAMSQRSFGVDAPRSTVEFRRGQGKANPGPYVPPIVISELRCFPAPGDDEFIELRNTSNLKWPLYDPARPNNRWQLRGDVEFDGFPVNASLQPGAFAIIVPFDPVTEPARLQTFRSRYQVPDATTIYGPYSGSLQTTSGSLELLRPDPPQVFPHPDAGFVPYITLEKVSYRVDGPWPETRPSFQRRNPFGYGNDPLNWKIAPPTAGGPNGTLPVITLHPQSQALIPSEPVTFSAAATGAPPLYFQWRLNGTNISGAVNANLTLEQPTAAAAGRYSVVVTGDEGSVESRVAVLKIDELVPTLTLESPKNGLRVTTNTLTVQGQVRDDVGVRSIRLAVNGTIRNVPPEGDRWSAQVELSPGTNAISAVAIDVANRESRPAAVSVVFVVLSPITVQAQNGMVLPTLNGTLLEVGRAYTVKATPSFGYIFADWHGPNGVIGATPSLTFVMASNLALTAQFVPNPFQSRSGLYQGLFFDSPPTLTGSGFISLKLTPAGTWSGTLRRGTSTAKVAGTFDWQGHSTNHLSLGPSQPITLALALDLETDANELTGRVTGAEFEAPLLGIRSYANPAAPYVRAGSYTFVIPGTNDTGRFAGDGFGTLTVDSKGAVALAGSLADAARATQKVFVSGNDQWPIYLPLDAGLGVLAGWVTFADFPQEEARGSLLWIKSSDPNRQLYPDGFTNRVMLSGSRYTPTRYGSGRLLGFDTGILEFDRGAGIPTLVELVQWGTDNRVTSHSGRPLSMRITAKSGLYTGQWTAPNGDAIAFRGVLHQSGDFASGYFVSSNATGRAWVHGVE